ncbi:hypothetical protein GW17_00029150 [Ensete ventricosum]|nr:hypothetical protein GW17_00029150 [Ensete ventricosum]
MDESHQPRRVFTVPITQAALAHPRLPLTRNIAKGVKVAVLTFDVVEAEGDRKGEAVRDAGVPGARPYLINLQGDRHGIKEKMRALEGDRVWEWKEYLDGEGGVGEEVIELRNDERRQRWLHGHDRRGGGRCRPWIVV